MRGWVNVDMGFRTTGREQCHDGRASVLLGNAEGLYAMAGGPHVFVHILTTESDTLPKASSFNDHGAIPDHPAIRLHEITWSPQDLVTQHHPHPNRYRTKKPTQPAPASHGCPRRAWLASAPAPSSKGTTFSELKKAAHIRALMPFLST